MTIDEIVGSSKNIIQAIESIKLKRFGIQFHLESDDTEYGVDILKNFIKFCENLWKFVKICENWYFILRVFLI